MNKSTLVPRILRLAGLLLVTLTAQAGSHTAKQTPPIQLGTSGGWNNDLANGYCCGGTLGSLVQDAAGKKYILSNFHVLAGDRVGGANGTANPGSAIVIQPGLIDVGCRAADAQAVAVLSAYADPVLGANVDAAIAVVDAGMVAADGSILEIGPLSSQTVDAFLGQSVKKSGRTTGLSRSSVSGLNATVTVAYDDECAGSIRGQKTFTGQILVKNRGSRFLNAGDSGSLMVENIDAHPRAVGLLFAGSSRIAVANPIHEVLNFFSVNMVGQATAVAAASADVVFDASLQSAKNVQQRHARSLETIPHGVGHALGAAPVPNGRRPVILVLVETDGPDVRQAVPNQLEGVPVLIEVVGKIVAF